MDPIQILLAIVKSPLAYTVAIPILTRLIAALPVFSDETDKLLKAIATILTAGGAVLMTVASGGKLDVSSLAAALLAFIAILLSVVLHVDSKDKTK